MQSERKHARRMSGGAIPSPNQVLKNQRDTPGRATTGQNPRNPRNNASSVRAQENGRNRHFRTRTLRTENHPEKVETDKHRPGAREITMSRGRDVARSNARTAMPETRNHDHTLGKPTHGNAQVKSITCQAAEADQSPGEGERQQGQDPLLRWLEVHTESMPEAKTIERGTHSATEQTGRPKDDTRIPRGMAGNRSQEPNCSNSFIRDQINRSRPDRGTPS